MGAFDQTVLPLKKEKRTMKSKEGKCVIAMSSMPCALRAEGLLTGDGLYTRIIKLPQGKTKKGCAYGLELPCAFARQAILRLEKEGVRHGDLLS